MQHEEFLVCCPKRWSQLVKAIIDWIPKQLFSTRGCLKKFSKIN